MAGTPRFRPSGQQDLAPLGQAARARANLDALQTLREVQAADRPATAIEQQILARWSGWGALPLVFDTSPTRERYDSEGSYQRALARWEAFGEVRTQVRDLLSETEWGCGAAAARRPCGLDRRPRGGRVRAGDRMPASAARGAGGVPASVPGRLDGAGT